MCGRYARARNLEKLRKKLRIARMVLEELGIIPKQGYNVAPTQSVTTFKMQDGAIVETDMRWGMFSTWSPAPIINARSESIEAKSMFKEAFLRRRCVQPAAGFYEWQKLGSKKQPYYVTRPDSEMLFAGIWSPGELETCAVITTAAPKEFSHIHDRVPLILDEAEIVEWLDPKTPVERLR